MSSIPADAWMFLGATLFAGGVGAWAWFSSNRETAAAAASLAAATGGRVDGDACVVDVDGLAFRVRRTRERVGEHATRDVLQVELDVPCPAWLTLIKHDRIGGLLAGSTGPDALATARWPLPGYRIDTASPRWTARWLGQGRVRSGLTALVRERVTLLRLRPDGIECRRAIDEAECDAPAVAVRTLLAALGAVVDETRDFEPDLVRDDERAADFHDRTRPLLAPFVVLSIAALALLPAIGLTHGRPSLPWGAELELGGAALAAVVGLLAYRPRAQALVHGRENAGQLYVSGMAMMGVGLALIGMGCARPLAYLVA